MTPAPWTALPEAGLAKRSYVRGMFSEIAPRYDVLNHALSLNTDRRWRRRAVNALGWQSAPQGTYLDLCAGTLDLSLELVRRPGFHGRVVGADFALPMLVLGRRKAPEIRALGADALELPFAERTFDGCMVAFGGRNLGGLDRGLGEIARVLKPGAGGGGACVVPGFRAPGGGAGKAALSLLFPARVAAHRPAGLETYERLSV